MKVIRYMIINKEKKILKNNLIVYQRKKKREFEGRRCKKSLKITQGELETDIAPSVLWLKDT